MPPTLVWVPVAIAQRMGFSHILGLAHVQIRLPLVEVIIGNQKFECRGNTVKQQQKMLTISSS